MNNTFAIEKKVPIPAYRGSYPLNDMKIGDSFFVPNEVRSIETVRTTVYSYSSRGQNGIKFRTAKSKNPLGIRVWRVA